ncbi:ABC transporter permease subunit [Schaalia vaccimaxillae]|uniref:ABC transporter permease subunit n=1 Tax=Schaalia vaccimaxillae TaxID=183916 RepID=UPI0003B3A21A|nr:ABC transporter permease subunit [Schaalia vaccimaxillae]
MSTNTITPDSTVPTVPSRSQRNAVSFNGKQTLMRAIRAEWAKMATLMSTWITSVIAIALTAGLGAAIVIMTANEPELAEGASSNIIVAVQFGQVVVAVLGALAITGEYSLGQIRSSLAAVPKRSRLFFAKAVVVVGFGFVLGFVSMFVAWTIAAIFVGNKAGSLTDLEFLGYFWGTGLTYAGTALLALAFGFLLRSTAGAITTIMTLLFVVSIPLSLMGIKWEWMYKVRAFEPLNLASSVYDPFETMMEWGVADTTQFLTHTQAVLGFVGWSVIPLAIAWVVFSKRDA